MAWATGASSADTWSFLPFARKPSAKGWNTFLSTSSPGIGHQRQGGRPMQGPGLEVLQHVRAGAGRLAKSAIAAATQGSRCHGGPGYAGDGRVQGWLEAKRALQKEEVPADGAKTQVADASRRKGQTSFHSPV